MTIIRNMKAAQYPSTQPRLTALEPGGRARINEINTRGGLGHRLLEMGLTPGTMVEVVRKGPFADPIQLCVRGYMLSLRRTQAQCITISREADIQAAG